MPPVSLTRGFFSRPIPEPLHGLIDLALDLRWSGSQTNSQLWQRLDPDIWARTHNPYMLLQITSEARLEEAARDPEIVASVSLALKTREKLLTVASWSDKPYHDIGFKGVAYFSMEFGLSEALPIYAGGLGILAGDHLKTSSDLCVPLTGIGLLYDQGYFQQTLTADGWQIEAYPYNDPTFLPVTPVPGPDGGWLRFPVDLPGRQLWLRAWKASVGNISLYLLDSNDPFNTPGDRALTSTLYSGEPEHRLMQEMALGIGGWQLLRMLGIEFEVCHLNEGHAAFVVLARAREFMLQHKLSFYEALAVTRVGNVFTTHTPVAAGFDRFDSGMVRRYLHAYADSAGIPIEEILNLGSESGDRFNMAFLATRGSGQVNGVSRLHGKVSRGIFAQIYPRWPISEIPVGHVTNGVHVASWDSPHAEALWMRDMPEEIRQLDGDAPGVGAKFPENVTDAELFELRKVGRACLIPYVRQRLAKQLQTLGAPDEEVARAGEHLDPDILTIGFARRFATYKRPLLLLTDIDRLVRILNNPSRPVQVIVAGKAHPRDDAGRHMIQTMVQAAKRPDVAGRLVFLADYDISLTQHLAAGVDVWLNNPLRPMEASGTSGMKILVNGGLNLSELDGWWAEAYSPEVGWAMGDGEEHYEPDWDAREAEQLYTILENEIVPEFYDRSEDWLPKAWLARVRASMSRLTPQFSAERMVREYVDNLYRPAAAQYLKRSADGGKIGADVERWHQGLRHRWETLRFGFVRFVEFGGWWNFEVAVQLGQMKPCEIKVQLYAEDPAGGDPELVEMQHSETVLGEHVYRARVQDHRPGYDYTARIIPSHQEALIPMEVPEILWQK